MFLISSGIREGWGICARLKGLTRADMTYFVRALLV